MERKVLLSAVFGAGVLAYACGGGGSVPSATVGAYITDASGNYTSVNATIREVSLTNSVSGETCVLFSSQNGITTNLVDLQNSMRLLDMTTCPVGTYNRIKVVIDRYVSVSNSTQSNTCTIDPDGMMAMNDEYANVSCDNETCTVEVLVEDGGLTIFEGRVNEVAIDFELTDSDGDGMETEIRIDNLAGNCTIAFEIEEIEPEEMEEHMKDKKYEIEGTVVDIGNNTMSLQLEHGMTVSVDISGINATGVSIDKEVEVRCSSFDLNTVVCVASEIEIES